jgi:phosphoglycerate dehydrogenase-like enzyme
VNTTDWVAVCSRSFSQNDILRRELLARYANVTFNDAGAKLTGDSLVAFLRGHSKAITALEVIDESILAQLPELKVISKYGVGLDMIDVEAMRGHGKRLGWTGGVNRRSVAELVLCFAIALLRGVPATHREVLAGMWRQHIGGQLTGRTVGIIGCGHIGKEVIRLLIPFECPILVNDIQRYPDFYDEYHVTDTDIETLLSTADLVTLHLPLNQRTRGILNAHRLSLMKSSAILINTARGGLIDETALKDLLKERRIAAAAFDVFDKEPPTDMELLSLPNFLATPHIGGSAEEAILAMGRAAIDQLDERLSIERPR